MVTVIDVLNQMTVVIPSIIAASCVLTSVITGMFKIEKAWISHLVSWIVAVLSALLFVQCNGLTFGFGNWDYAVAAVCGVITGAASNGVYDWASVKLLMNTITMMFTPKAQN